MKEMSAGEMIQEISQQNKLKAYTSVGKLNTFEHLQSKRNGKKLNQSHEKQITLTVTECYSASKATDAQSHQKITDDITTGKLHLPLKITIN